MLDDKINESAESIGDALKRGNTLLNQLNEQKTRISDVTANINNMAQATLTAYDYMVKLDKSMGTVKMRSEEMMQSFGGAVANITRLGGNYKDVYTTIENIAKASKRNVIESEEVLTKIYATSKVLNQDSGELVNAFKKVGYETKDIGENLQLSVEYVRNVGLNTETVMKSVVNNTEQLSRFNFENGVQGLTKMAAQASMLRFDMGKTFDFADKVLDPKGAIDMASAFQRLGVAVGSLGDPFQMMNQAINDPSGLQDSLIKMTKQFTYFDEKTKSFKISPNGILTFKELEQQGVANAKQLRETALAAADLDRRLSQVKLDVPDEDKTLLANMARMGEGGQYEVTIKNDEGITTTKNLTDVTKDEFKELKKIQEKAPKTMEEISIKSLSIQEDLLYTTKSIADKLGFAPATSKYVTSNLMGAERISKSITSTVSDLVPSSRLIGKKLDEGLDKMKDLFLKKDNKNISQEEFTKEVKKLEDNFKDYIGGLPKQALEGIKGAIKEVNDKIQPKSDIEKMFKYNITQPLADMVGGGGSIKSIKVTPETLKSSQKTALFGDEVASTGNTPLTQKMSSISRSKIDFDGTVIFKVDAPPGVSVQWLNNYLNSVEYQKKVTDMLNDYLIRQGVIKGTGRTQ